MNNTKTNKGQIMYLSFNNLSIVKLVKSRR